MQECLRLKLQIIFKVSNLTLTSSYPELLREKTKMCIIFTVIALSLTELDIDVTPRDIIIFRPEDFTRKSKAFARLKHGSDFEKLRNQTRFSGQLLGFMFMLPLVSV